MAGVGRAALVAALSAAVLQVPAPPARATHDCGLAHETPLWIDFGTGAVPPEVRAVLARPGVVVASSGTALPAQYRASGAATTYFELNLPRYVGEPATPADPASITAGADRLFDLAVASTACPTPWIALNELLGSHLPAPWSPTNAQYRANVLALVDRLAARGARPVLLVHGSPNATGDAAAWWQAVSRSAHLVYESYYNAVNISRLGPVVGSRRMRMGMRSIVRLFTRAGIPRERLGFMLGFQVAPGAAGREGLQPREAWFRVVKWEAMAARQVALDERTATVWSWGWGNFGPQSVDPDKPTAACVYLWARDPALCDGPAAAGSAFETSLGEGQILNRATVQCAFPGGSVMTAAVTGLTRLTRDRQTSLTALFARAALQARVPVSQADVLRVERKAIARAFRGSRAAYLRALRRRGATVEISRGAIADELRRRRISTLRSRPPGQTVLIWSADVEAAAVDAATCLRDELPGSGEFPRSDKREVGVVPLLARLPFLFADRLAPARPSRLTAVPGEAGVTLDWADGREPDLAGYEVYRATSPAGPFALLTSRPIPRSTFVAATPAPGTRAVYAVRAVDSSGNRSARSQIG
jgi:hypothetical protein